MAKATAMPADEWEDHAYHGDPEREWNEFWADICAPGGKPDLAQIKLELSDLSMLMHHVPRVYSHVTGGLISIPTTLPNVVCSVHDGHVQDLCEEERADALLQAREADEINRMEAQELCQQHQDTPREVWDRRVLNFLKRTAAPTQQQEVGK